MIFGTAFAVYNLLTLGNGSKGGDHTQTTDGLQWDSPCVRWFMTKPFTTQTKVVCALIKSKCTMYDLICLSVENPMMVMGLGSTGVVGISFLTSVLFPAKERK